MRKARQYHKGCSVGSGNLFWVEWDRRTGEKPAQEYSGQIKSLSYNKSSQIHNCPQKVPFVGASDDFVPIDFVQRPGQATMPIKFRCAYCRQLMSIARRKAGTVIRCPTCSGQVIVPKPEEEHASATQGAVQPAPQFPSDNGGGLFEEDNFEDNFLDPVADPDSASPSVEQPLDHQAPMSSPDFAATPPAPGLRGVFLTTGRLVLVILIVVLLLVISFVLGLIAGKTDFFSSQQEQPQQEVRSDAPLVFPQRPSQRV